MAKNAEVQSRLVFNYLKNKKNKKVDRGRKIKEIYSTNKMSEVCIERYFVYNKQSDQINLAYMHMLHTY